jgi:hypothetical protein
LGKIHRAEGKKDIKVKTKKRVKRSDKSDTIKKHQKSIEDDTKRRQELFIQIFENKACNVSLACKAVNIHRSTYYDWRKKYSEFADKCDEIEYGLIDMAESQLYINIRNGKETSLIFFLCNRRPERWRNVQHIGIDVTSKTMEVADRLAKIITGEYDKTKQA